ncbi:MULTISPECIES: hypothetical protein [unclassified Clostridium]|uniref:hypothetical protein n=1 Tax=unclassified Clostridium TaxID=2614128 RepID=UPI00189A8C82|nr:MULTISPECIES: hypothetical protein [unclassified Clostridium]MCR1949731.1 hypothetical protein [Clostridium sp. DSM 100503]
MNKKRIRNIFLVNFILLISIFLYGCKSEIEEENKVDILNGAIAIENSGEYKIYNLTNDKYEKVDTEYIITAYDLESGNFIYNENGEYKIKYLGKEERIEDGKKVISPKIAQNGEYLAYFLKDEFLDLKIKDLSKNKNISIDTKVSISGELVDWLNENTLVYYGISEDKINGIFTYNINNNEEKLLYKLDLGYVEFLKVLDNGIVFVQEKEGKQKILKVIDESGEVNEVIEDVLDVSDVESTPDGIFILGKLENNSYSLYKYHDKKARRLVYDFPKLINLEKGLSKDKDGNIIFVGGEDVITEKVYRCTNDAISIIDGESGTYNFIECR